MTVGAIRGWAAALPLILSFGAGASSPARANSLLIEQTPVTNAVAEMDHVFGITIVVKGAIDPEMPVTVSLDDTSAPGAVLDAVNQLSNDIGATFQKSVVISKLPKSEAVPPVHIDGTTEIYFSDNTVGAEDAIQRVASLDSAEVNFTDAVSGTIFLPDVEFTLTDAANDIAQRTHTRWQSVYTLSIGQSSNVPEGKVVDRTNEGQPIIQLPYSVYDSPPPSPTPPTAPKSGKDKSTDTTAKTTDAQAPTNELPYNPDNVSVLNFGSYNPPLATGQIVPPNTGVVLLPGVTGNNSYETVTTSPYYTYP